MEKYNLNRNGEDKPFEPYKIKDAIIKSFTRVSLPLDERVFDKIIPELTSKKSK